MLYDNLIYSPRETWRDPAKRYEIRYLVKCDLLTPRAGSCGLADSASGLSLAGGRATMTRQSASAVPQPLS